MAASGAESTIRMPGIVLSSLMFQHLNSDSDVEGLIVGENIFEEQVTISDSQADNILIEEIYNIQKHIACQKIFSFYNSVGDVDPNALRKLLGDIKEESVIGWYRQRRNTEQRMTLREKAVHENLKKTLSNPHMIFLLLTPSPFTSSGSTYKTEYAAYILRSRKNIHVPVLVNNLGSLDPVSYCKASALCSAVGYNQTMKKHRSKFFSSNDVLNEVENINSMNDTLQSELHDMCQAVEKSEKQLEALHAEVSALKRKVQEKKQHTLKKDPGDSPEPKRNMLLHKAVRALFARSPLFLSQTLTSTAYPLLDFSCSLEDTEETLTPRPQSPEDDDLSELLQRKRPSRKRPTEVSIGSEHKRKKT